MKYRIQSIRVFLTVTLLTISPLIWFSCDDQDDELLEENVQASDNESTVEAITDELDDLGRIALSGQDPASGGRIAKVADNRLDCEGTTITFSNVSSDKSSGTATITFGPNGCTDNRGNVRKGTVVITWSGGKWYQAGSVHTIALQNYSINGIGIDGNRTLTCATVSGTLSAFSIQWNINATHSFIWPDNTNASRTVNKTKQWDHTSTSDVFTISNGPSGENAAEGTNRHGVSYTMSIATPLVYNASCIQSNKVFLPVSGIKVFTNTETGKELTIDFGDGGCDNTFVVSHEGASKTVTAKND